jgi:hypothetical protein
LQILLLLVITQPLGLLAMPCHTNVAGADVAATHEHRDSHHGGETQYSAMDAVLSESPLIKPGHDCCGAGALCLMSGCVVSLSGHAAAELLVPLPLAEFHRYHSGAPDAPVSPLYRPPIFL